MVVLSHKMLPDEMRGRHARSLAALPDRCRSTHGGSPRAYRAWPLAWPSPSGPLGRSLLHDALRLSARRRLRRERYEILTISVNVNYSSYSNGLCSALHLLIVHADRRAM